MDKIRLDLFKLKTKADLEGVYQYFKKNTSNWFNEDGFGKSEFFKPRSCPICNEEKSESSFIIDNFNYEECTNCGSVYTKPSLKGGVLVDLYKKGEYQVYQKNLVEKSSGIRKGILEKRKFNQIKNILNKNVVTLLDVGCGKATFLDICKNEGWFVEGIDPSPSSKHEAYSNYQILVHEGDFLDIEFEKKFDVITFWGVLEHLENPVSALEKANRLLTQEGIIAFEVPSADCFLKNYLKKYPFGATRYIESARHNIFFSKKGIEQLADQFKLNIELIESNGLDIQTILFNEFNESITDKILNIQDVINDLLLGDHYRVFFKKEYSGIDTT